MRNLQNNRAGADPVFPALPYYCFDHRMKQKTAGIFLFLVMLLMYARAKADGGAHFFIIRFTIETTGNKVSKGYGYIPEGKLVKDSFGSTHYLMHLLDQPYENRSIKDSMAYYEGCLKYTLPSNPAVKDAEGTVYTLTDLEHLSFKRIKSMQIDTIFPFSRTPAVQNQLKMADTVWLKNKPVRDIEIEPLSCYYRVIIYENTLLIHDLMQKIARLEKEIIDIQYANEETDRKERQIYELLKKLKKEKVVIIEACSC